MSRLPGRLSEMIRWGVEVKARQYEVAKELQHSEFFVNRKHD